MTSRMQQSTLQPLYSLLIIITCVLLLASSICLAPLGDARGQGAGSGSGAGLAKPAPSAWRRAAS